MLRIIFPTSYRKRRSASKNVYGFYISLSYDEINYSDSLTLVIYNDLCYSCSASTMECNRTVRKHNCCLHFHNEIKILFFYFNSYSDNILNFQSFAFIHYCEYTLPFYIIVQYFKTWFIP